MWKLISLSVLQALFLCAGQVLLKLGLAQSGPFQWKWDFFRSQLTNYWYPACGVCFGLATILWFHILKHYPFSIAYPLSCISYVFGMIAALMVFHENVAWTQWLGVMLIMAGCVLIVK
ncbi:MAG: EamA family transporter [Bacteroidales bacterium]|nr:EamA family transporter [Bacteroidales bacterium]